MNKPQIVSLMNAIRGSGLTAAEVAAVARYDMLTFGIDDLKSCDVAVEGHVSYLNKAGQHAVASALVEIHMLMTDVL